MSEMTRPFNIKLEILKNLIDKVDCHNCGIVPGLDEKSQERYICMKGTHPLCNLCKERGK